ncbi:hypothetical protein [Microtetraspora malaysiensis]|uniref:hypothetical protein n=1 Tax=Microtetraspora malaysiensis TaxID=161358 RepID=UPI003D8E8A61
MQSPGLVGGAGVAPDYLPSLLFGPHGIEGLTRTRPDVYGRDKELFQALSRRSPLICSPTTCRTRARIGL